MTLTDKGKELMKQMMPKHKEFVEYVFNSLNSEEKEAIVRPLKEGKRKSVFFSFYLEFKINKTNRRFL